MSVFEGTSGSDVLPPPGSDNSGDDLIYGYAGDDTLSGGAGDDVIQGGLGADHLSGGAGLNDVLDYYDSVAGVSVNLATLAVSGGDAQGDTIAADFEVIWGSDGGNDALTGAAGDDYLFGYAGNDTVVGGTGDDQVDGGAGADHLSGGAGIDFLTYFDSGAGVSVNLTTLAVSGGDAQGDIISADFENLRGSDYADTLTGSAGDNYILGGNGNDSIFGMAGDDDIAGGSGADHLSGGAGIDLLDYYDSTAGVSVNLTTLAATGGDAQGDVISADFEDLQGSAYADTLTGSAGDNYIHGSTGDDTLSGMAGNDTIQGWDGADHLSGGAGIDTLDYYYSAAGVSVNLATLAVSGGQAQGDVIAADFENVWGADGAADILTGSAGDNELRGYGGNDTLSGGAGDDLIRGGLGADHLSGRAGTDTLDYYGNAGITVNLTTLAASGGEAQGDVIGADFENIWATDLADILTGSAGGNELRGYGGNDTLSGMGGGDSLYGGNGNDILRGDAGADHLDGGTGADLASYYTGSTGVSVNLATGAGSGGDAQGDTLASIENLSGSQGSDILVGNSSANTLQGWNGNDVLTGAGGKDTLTGGAGADRFVYSTIGDSVVGTGADRITDFSHAQADRIDLAAIDADTGTAGNQAFSFIGTGLYTHHAGELRYAINGGITTIAGDVNGDGTSDFHIQLTGSIALAAGDFVL